MVALSADIQAVVAADYIRNLREEVIKGFYGRLKQGLNPMPAPLGYPNDGGGMAKTIDPIAAPLSIRLSICTQPGDMGIGCYLDGKPHGPPHPARKASQRKCYCWHSVESLLYGCDPSPKVGADV